MPALKLSQAPRALSTLFIVTGRGGAPLSKSAGQWLIGVEVALALVLITSAGLMLRSFARLVSVDLGYNVDNVLTLEVEPLDRPPAIRRNYYTSLTEAVRQMPEVVSAGAIDQTGLSGGGFYTSVSTDVGTTVGGPQRTVLPAVARRTREIGVRVAIGARPTQVVAAMIGGAVPPVIFGLAAGTAGTYYATRIITSFLFQTDPHDPGTLAAVVAVLGAAAWLAAWLPARRAASIDPVTALRAD